MFIIYRILISVFFFAILPFWYALSRFNAKLGYAYKEKLGCFPAPALSQNVIHFHAISVGEVNAVENLVKRAAKEFPDYDIVLTTGTRTGQEIAHKKLGDVCKFITYYPFDIPCCVKNFFDKIHPSLIIIAETELWPVFTDEAFRRRIPVCSVNARISDSTFKSYKLLKFFIKPILEKYTANLTQSKADMDKLVALGANPETTKVMGNLKFDIEPKHFDINIENDNNRIIIAGSTHSGEEEIILTVFKKLKKEFPDIKLLIAPRHNDRIKDVEKVVNDFGFSFGLRSNNDNFIDNDIVILDTMGELGKIYTICHFAFIGGSFNNTGGHNPLEALIFNKPVITGPTKFNFKDIYKYILLTNAGSVANNVEELEEQMRKLLSDDEYYSVCCSDCRKIFETSRGALDFSINEIKNILGKK